MRVPCLFAAIVLCACSSEGTAPPTGRLNFPSAIAVVGESLVVANSNFTLAYNSGSLHAYDINVLNDALEAHCGDKTADERDFCGIIPREDSNSELSGGGLDVLAVDGLLTSEVLIGSYVAGMAAAPTPTGMRVYMPVRSDANLTFVDLGSDGCLSCGGAGSSCDLGTSHTCSDAFRRGDDQAASSRGIELPSDPVGIAVGPVAEIGGGGEGTYVITAHRGGRASLFLDDGTAAPFLVHTIGDLPAELVGVAVDPVSQLMWLPNARQPVISRLGAAIDATTGASDRSYLYDAGALALQGVDTGSFGVGDSRVVRFDPRPDVRRAYILSRRPRALLSVDINESVGSLAVRDVMEVGVGPSRLEVRHFEASDRTLGFVSCFDSRDVYVLDLDQGRLAGIVRGLGGAFELATYSDAERDFLYVLDFQASAIRVLDLKPMFQCLEDTSFGGSVERECSPQQLGFVGRPRSRQELI